MEEFRIFSENSLGEKTQETVQQKTAVTVTKSKCVTWRNNSIRIIKQKYKKYLLYDMPTFDRHIFVEGEKTESMSMRKFSFSVNKHRHYSDNKTVNLSINIRQTIKNNGTQIYVCVLLLIVHFEIIVLLFKSC